jgi:hypothetical protein
MNTTGMALKINDDLTVRVGDIFVNAKGAKLYIDGFTKTNRVRFTLQTAQGGFSPTSYSRTPDAFLGHIQRERWTRAGGN